MTARVDWFEICTTSPDRARDFYSALFGWRFETAGDDTTVHTGPGAPGGMINTFGMPPTVLFTVHVDDVAAACESVTAAGGSAVSPVRTTPDLTFTYVTDVDGNLMGLWTPAPDADTATSWGAPGPGSVGWFEVLTGDLERAKAFYGQAFGWSFSDPTGVGTYWCAHADGEPFGGITGLRAGPDPQAVINVLTDDTDRTCARAVELGATVAGQPETTPAGLRRAYLTDPEGNAFGVYTPPPAG